MKFYEAVKFFVESKKKTIAVVPGSFKPPHAGHASMIDKYSKKADEVVVIVSAPGKQKRLTKSGKEITPQDAIKIFEIFKKAFGWKNVKFEISKEASPIKAAYDFIEHDLKDVDVFLGASDKGGDWKRWMNAPKYFAKSNPSVTIIDPQKAAVKAFGDVSAGTIRDNVDNPDIVKELLPDKLSDSDIEKIINIIK
jgi:cytidyltransferase-like protein